jgi:hypothetical protein
MLLGTLGPVQIGAAKAGLGDRSSKRALTVLFYPEVNLLRADLDLLHVSRGSLACTSKPLTPAWIKSSPRSTSSISVIFASCPEDTNGAKSELSLNVMRNQGTSFVIRCWAFGSVSVET